MTVYLEGTGEEIAVHPAVAVQLDLAPGQLMSPQGRDDIIRLNALQDAREGAAHHG